MGRPNKRKRHLNRLADAKKTISASRIFDNAMPSQCVGDKTVSPQFNLSVELSSISDMVKGFTYDARRSFSENYRKRSPPTDDNSSNALEPDDAYDVNYSGNTNDANGSDDTNQHCNWVNGFSEPKRNKKKRQSKRPLTYTGDSATTRWRRRKENELKAKGKIDKAFRPASVDLLVEADNDTDNYTKFNFEFIFQALEKKKDLSIRERCVLIYFNFIRRGYCRMRSSVLASEAVGRGKYLAKQLRRWAKIYQHTGSVPCSRRGKHQKKKRILDLKDVKTKVVDFLATKKHEICVDDVMDHFRYAIFPGLGIDKTISRSTTRRILHDVGYQHQRYKKGMYVDGHERPDVVEARKSFVNIIDQHLSMCATFDGE